jgi:DNA polymerase
MLTVRAFQRGVWDRHQRAWSDCTRCPLCTTAKHHVLARGQLPCDILFVGEAPGTVEDAIGEPFIGPSGKLLDKLIKLTRTKRPGSIKSLPRWTYAITNVVACIPWDQTRGGIRVPTPDEAAACSGRVHEILRMARPRGLVLLGRIAEKTFSRLFLDDLDEANVGIIDMARHDQLLCLQHPAYILRVGGINSLSAKTFAVKLRAFLASLPPRKSAEYWD